MCHTTSKQLPQQQHKPAKRYLFLVSAGRAHMRKLPAGYYALTLDVPFIDQVVRFTDRPYREASFISGKALKNLWANTGHSNFATDHPNAVLFTPHCSSDCRGVSVGTDANHISFIVKPIHQRMPAYGFLQKVTLTIDSLKKKA